MARGPAFPKTVAVPKTAPKIPKKSGWVSGGVGPPYAGMHMGGERPSALG